MCWWKYVLACLPGIETVGSQNIYSLEQQVSLMVCLESGRVAGPARTTKQVQREISKASYLLELDPSVVLV
jgi:hypothetical protein